MSVSHTTNSYMNTLGHISSLKNYGITDAYRSSSHTNQVWDINHLEVYTISGSTGTFNSVSGSVGTFNSVSGSVGTFNSLTTDSVSGSTGTFNSVMTNKIWGSTGNFNSLTTDSLIVGNLVLDSTPSIVTFTDDNGMIIDLGRLSTINIQTITLPSNINYVTYKNGLSNGMYIVKVVLSSFSFSLGNHSNVIPNVFSNTNTTFTSPYVLVNINVFLDETSTLQYFSNATPYFSSTSY